VLAAAVVSNMRGCGAEFQALIFGGGALARPQGLGHRRHRLSHLGAMYVQQGVFLLCIQLPRAVRLPGRRWKMLCEK
jgi:hypothetical protein